MGLMVLIFLFSSQNAQASSAVSSPFADFLQSLLAWLPEHLAVVIVRKGAHFSIYAALGFMLFFTLLPQTGSTPVFSWKAPLLGAWALCTLYAMSDEIHQLFVAGRSGELRDVLLDSCGSLTGIIIALLLAFWVFHLHQSRQSRNSSSVC